MRQTIEETRDILIGKQYIPRNLVWRDVDLGQVEVVVYNICGDMTEKDAGVPMVRFEATNFKTNDTKVFVNLWTALAHCGMYGK